MKLELRMIIQTSKERWERPLDMRHFNSAIWRLGVETLRQLDSPQWLLQQGFRKVSCHE